MKAIGASDGDVKKLFFAEAGAMGILGGIVGVILGWAIGQVITWARISISSVSLFRPSISGQCLGGWLHLPWCLRSQ